MGGTLNSAGNRSCLIRTRCQKKNLPRLTNRRNPRGKRLFGHIFNPLEKATIRRNRTLGQIDQTGAGIGRTARLVKSNMSIATNAEQPQIHTATCPYPGLKSLALEIGIHCHAIGYMRIPQ